MQCNAHIYFLYFITSNPGILHIVQGRLLTHRAGGKHGDEDDLRWRFTSPAGCREELLDPPDLGSTTAVDHDMFLEK
jgi:hypothetical protein